MGNPLNIVGDIFNSILGGNSSRADQQKYLLEAMEVQQQYAQQNMATMNRYNIDAFNRENAWNAPGAQQQRNYAAGINPMWQDGSGAVVAQQDSGVSAASPSGAMTAGGNSVSLGDIVNLATASKQLKKLDSDIEVNDATIGEKRASAHKALTEADNVETQTNEYPANQQSLRALQDAQRSQAAAAAGLTEEEKLYYKMDLDKKWEAQDWDNKSDEAKIKEINTLLPANFAKMTAEGKYFAALEVYTRVLASLEPKKVAIAQQEANASSQNAQTNSFNAITSRIQTNENIRHNKKVESIQSALNNSIQDLNKAQSSYYDSSTGKVNAEKYYQDMYNTVYDNLEKSGVTYEIQNSIMWKLKAEKESILRDIEMKGLEIEYFNDTYFGRLLKDYLPIPFLSK